MFSVVVKTNKERSSVKIICEFHEKCHCYCRHLCVFYVLINRSLKYFLCFALLALHRTGGMEFRCLAIGALHKTITFDDYKAVLMN